MRASKAVGIESTKPAKEQHDTAIRMRYPQLHKRPENVFLLGQAYGFFILLAFAIAVLGFWVSVGAAAQLMSGVAAVLYVLIYSSVVVATRTGSPVVGVFALPIG